MSCKLWGKVTSVSVNINFCKNGNFVRKELKFGKMWLFYFTTESDYLFAKCAYFLEKSDFLCEGLYTLTKCQILKKKLY